MEPSLIQNIDRSTRCFCKSLLVMMILHSSVPVFAQSVRDISTKDGLPQSFVSGLVQDDSSFVWIGTRNGLARYDGIQFKVFQHNSRDSSTLASNLIIWIRRDRQNQLWIEFESGEIDVMDPVTEKIRHFLKGNENIPGSVQFIRRGWMVDEDGTFWGIIKGAGLNRFDTRTKKLEKFNRLVTGFASDTVRGMLEIKNKGIWILNDRELGLIDKKTKQFTHWPLPFRQDFGNLPDNDAIAIDLHERKNGELMWGDRQQLYFFNPETHSFRNIPLPSFAYLGIRWIRTGADGYDYLENFGKVYRYGDKTGLNSIGKTITDFFGDVKSFLVDHSGVIWLGTNAQGIHLIDLETPFFQSYPNKKDFVTDLLQQELGIGLKQVFNWNTNDQVFSQPSYYFRSVYDPHKRLYLALKQTVCFADSGQKTFTRLPDVPLIAESEKLRVGIRGITIMQNGSPMVAGYNGNILFYDPVLHGWKPFIDTGYLRRNYGAALLPLGILADEKYVWVTTEADGLFRIDNQTKKITRLTDTHQAGSLPSNQLLSIKADPLNRDRLWIGSYQGLILLNKQSMTCEVFSQKEGLPDNTVYSILFDFTGKIWLSTNKGICRFDPETHKVRAFHTIDGLPGDEFNRFHNLEMPDGRLAFGGTDGWTIFNPLRIKNDSFETRLAFTDLKINNRDVIPVSEKDPLKSPVNSLNRLVLPYEQNTLSFSFAGLQFSQPQDLQYRYRMVGYDNDWVMAGNSHQANYTKIPPGNYTLLVNASNSTGKWSDHIKSLNLVIRPPWWATRMAWACYFIIAAGLAWTFIRFRVSRLVMLQEIDLKKRESRQMKELDDMKTRFFSNITHEFRTPLTLIMGPAEQLKSVHSRDPQQVKLADTIVNNAKQLLVLINRLMDLSKLEARALQIHEQRGNPADVVGSIVYSFETDAESKNVQLSFIDQTAQIDGWFYGDAIERIVYNLVSNSLKFTAAGGRVDIILSKEGESLCLIVKDTGTGISEKKLPHIFDRYYQADEHPSLTKEQWHAGTGIGLSLVKELVNQMKGKIEVQSRDTENGSAPTGTIFTLVLPFRTSPEEIAVAPNEENGFVPGEPANDSDKISQVLLVEDSMELAGFITGILATAYRVTHVANGALGLESALQNMPDLIISDVMMPVMDGYELCSRLKEDSRTSHIPVVLLTAKVSQENRIEGLTKGADDYLTKPFHPTELLLRIHNLLERQNKLRERFRQELSIPGSVSAASEPLPQDIFITRLYEILDEHLDDPGFGVDQLVGIVNMSRSSLHRKLKALTDMSTTEVVRNYRLKKATFLLREGYTSSDTAYKTGFGSPAYFTKSFREVYGVTPSEFVKNLKG